MATRTKVSYSYRNRNGQGLWLPPDPAIGLTSIALPNVYEQDSAQMYPLGTRLVIGQRTYHYYKAGGDINYTLAGIFSTQAMLNASVNSYDTSQAAGETVFKIDGTSDGSPAVDFYAGGYIVIFVASALGRPQMRIVSSLAAEATTPFTVALTLEQPLPCAVAANAGCEILPNRYASCVTGWGDVLAGGMYPCVGVPTRIMTSGRYGWVQTWGPCFVARTSTEMGAADLDRTAVFSTDGSIQPCRERWDAAKSSQLAGFSLAINNTGTGWIMLMIDP